MMFLLSNCHRLAVELFCFGKELTVIIFPMV